MATRYGLRLPPPYVIPPPSISNTEVSHLSRGASAPSAATLEHEAKVLMSFAPTLMLRGLEAGKTAHTPCTQQYTGVAIFADISGFSKLNERFATQGGEGFGRMMSLINMYFQQMIKIITACGGDVIKFAGDALIVLWVDAPKSVLTHRACECAMELQDVLHNAQMDHDLHLSLKIGIGVGSATMFYVGGYAGRCEYFAAGPALRESFEAANVASSGDVIVSAGVWAEVKGVCQAEENSGMWSLKFMQKTFRKRSLYQRSGPLLEHVRAALRSYTAPVLLKTMELEVSLAQSFRSWTSSVVQSSVVFIHFGIEGIMDLMALDCAKIHRAIVAVQRCVYHLQGCIHRFTVDDKGCVMKVVFGAHMPHEDQPYRALLAALQLRHALSLQGIQPALGVATGESLVGPVGGSVRQEFTVHGDRIIVAARLMQHAAKLGGMVLCDEATYEVTREEMVFMKLLPVELKGRKGVMQPFRPISSSQLVEPPVLRSKTAERFCSTSDSTRFLKVCHDWLATSNPEFKAVTVEGEHGSGKTQLLMQARELLKQHCRVLHVCCRAHEKGQSGSLIRRLLAQLCQHDVWPSLRRIIPMLSGKFDDSVLFEAELSLFRAHALASEESFEAAQPPAALAHEGNSGFCTPRGEHSVGHEKRARLLLIVDSIQFADHHSCQVIQALAARKPREVLLLVACRASTGATGIDEEGNTVTDYADGNRLIRGLSSDADTFAVKLHPLAPPICMALACAVLGADSIPLKVVQLVQTRAGGNPLLIEAIMNTLVRKGLLTCTSATAELADSASEAVMNDVASEVIFETRNSILSVKLSLLSMLQQLILKTMSLLPIPCSLAVLHQALPFTISLTMLVEQIRVLCERRFIASPMIHRSSLPGGRRTMKTDSRAGEYLFVDIGMKEVCEHSMLESQRRQVQIKLASNQEKDELSSDMRRSFSPDITGRLSGSADGLRLSDSAVYPRRPKKASILPDPEYPSSPVHHSQKEDAYNLYYDDKDSMLEARPSPLGSPSVGTSSPPSHTNSPGDRRALSTAAFASRDCETGTRMSAADSVSTLAGSGLVSSSSSGCYSGASEQLDPAAAHTASRPQSIGMMWRGSFIKTVPRLYFAQHRSPPGSPKVRGRNRDRRPKQSSLPITNFFQQMSVYCGRGRAKGVPPVKVKHAMSMQESNSESSLAGSAQAKPGLLITSFASPATASPVKRNLFG
ncbi:hypothetical protein AB1Y20_020631 [Prymnesium parvum]|uniref:Guanylate cyclase domain-containing protein n=1 Tax=Prymnesium parvum TaxID=97485 RepID=A0AB34JYN3_PRYPA